MRNRTPEGTFGQEATLGEAENLVRQWPEFFTLPTFGSDDPRATDRPDLPFGNPIS
jgi:hypothetical protein